MKAVFRLDDIFSLTTGIIITGVIESGVIDKGDLLKFGDKFYTIRGFESFRYGVGLLFGNPGQSKDDFKGFRGQSIEVLSINDVREYRINDILDK